MALTTAKLKMLSKKLCKAFSVLKDEEEIFAFMRDLMSESEIKEISQRLDIAQLLDKWESYKKIESVTKVSSTTIARVAKALKSRNKWYRIVLDKLPKKSK